MRGYASDIMRIKDLLETETCKRYKKEVCTNSVFDSCLYSKDGTPYGQYGTLHSTTLFTHLALMRTIFSRRTGTFIDLGSGSANLVIYAAHDGWNAIGIEKSKECSSCAAKNVEKALRAGFMRKENVKLISADFFPKGFRIEKMKNNSREDDFREKLEGIKNRKNIDAALLQEADLFYHYQVERRQNILDLFSRYAKRDAVLVFVETRKDSFKIPDDVALLDHHMGMSIYKKD